MAFRLIVRVFSIALMAVSVHGKSAQLFSDVKLSSTSILTSEAENNNESSSGVKLTDKVGGYIQINGVNLKNEHPRIAMSKLALKQALERAHGKNAVSPYKEWFVSLQDLYEKKRRMDPTSLAFLFLATREQRYFDSFLDSLPSSGLPRTNELIGIDMLYDFMPESVFYSLRDRVSQLGNRAFSYRGVDESQGNYNVKWGYHSAIKKKNALAYSLLMADHPLEIKKDPNKYPFDARNFLKIAQTQLEPGGHFYEIERRFSGSDTYNSALTGSPGGFYDNLAYDRAEESSSIELYSYWANATGSQAYKLALHDKYRAELYLNLGLPFTESISTSNSYCKKVGTVSGELPRIFDTSTTPGLDLNRSIKALSAHLYQDPYSQWFVENSSWLPNCKSAHLLTTYLLFFDTDIIAVDRDSMPTAKYFSGPGVSVMRADWQPDSAYGLFLAGEGFSRRYQDANSFIIHRGDFTIPHSGRRIRKSEINDIHHYYHRGSFSKNILRVFDPNESLDVNRDGTPAEPYSGVPIVASENFGGQIMTDYLSEVDGCFVTCSSKTRRGAGGYKFGAVERADINKYEHVEGLYTYTVGDASASYSGKVDFFDREFLFIAPDVFVIFDRVKVTDPSFRKMWTMHTVAEPVLKNVKTEKPVWGKTSADNVKSAVITQHNNITYIDTLYPESNRVTVRGGDTEFIKDAGLSDIKSTSLDIPRWLEIYLNGADLNGSITIYGATSDNEKDMEVVKFDGAKKEYFSSRTFTANSNQITVEGVNWKPNQWQGYKVKSGDIDGVITGNTSDTLFGTWPGKEGRHLTVYKTVGNTLKYWKRVDAVTTADMNIENITLSVPHYFDKEDVLGRVHSFAPQTDGKAFKYKWTPNIGQYSFDIEALEQNELQNFVNVISLKDPGQAKPYTEVSERDNTLQITLDASVLVFAKSREPVEAVSVSISALTRTIRLFNLLPNTTYYVNQNDKNIEIKSISLVNNGGFPLVSSSMGVLSFELDEFGYRSQKLVE